MEQPTQQRAGGDRTLVLGAGGQLGRALRALWGERDDVDFASRTEVDLGSSASIDAIDPARYGTIVNAAGYTAVDAAEGDGRRDAWAVNAVAPARLAALAARHGMALVHVSTDYVYEDGPGERGEDDPLAPLGAYAQSKAAGDLAAAVAPRHYVLRTAWVVGEGRNFVSTMASLAERGIDPAVVDDQIGRLTFASELARAIDHLLATGAPHGTYNVTNAGEPVSWAEVARRVFALAGHDPARVSTTTTEAYAAERPGTAPRPRSSALSLARLRATGFEPADHLVMLEEHVRGLAGA